MDPHFRSPLWIPIFDHCTLQNVNDTLQNFNGNKQINKQNVIDISGFCFVGFLTVGLLHSRLLHIGLLPIGILHIGLLHIGFLHKETERGKISGF
jgi:hypothetical protein